MRTLALRRCAPVLRCRPRHGNVLRLHVQIESPDASCRPVESIRTRRLQPAAGRSAGPPARHRGLSTAGQLSRRGTGPGWHTHRGSGGFVERLEWRWRHHIIAGPDGRRRSYLRSVDSRGYRGEPRGHGAIGATRHRIHGRSDAGASGFDRSVLGEYTGEGVYRVFGRHRRR